MVGDAIGQVIGHRARSGIWLILELHHRLGEVPIALPLHPQAPLLPALTLVGTEDPNRSRGREHVTSHGRTYDLSNPRDWRSLAEDGVDSAYESEKSSQRIQRAMTANAVAGRAHGRCPYGYLRTYDPRTGALTGQAVDPETAPVVREIIQRIAASEPVSAVTKDLNRRSIPSPTGTAWSRAVVRKVALNPTYIGQRIHEGEVHTATWEPVIAEADFYGARSVLQAPDRVGRRPGRTKHLASYIARCGVCGALLGAATSHGYFCSDGHHVQASIELVESVVEGAILARLEAEDILADLAGHDDAGAVQARDEAARLRARLEGFRDSAAMGELSPSSLAHVEARLVPQIEEAERRAQTAGMPAGVRALVGEGTIRAKWDSMPIAARREVVKMLADVHLHPARACGRHAANEFDRVRIQWKGADRSLSD